MMDTLEKVGTTDGCCSTLTSPIVTLIVGRDHRLFAAHEDILSLSPFFAAALKGQFYEAATKKVELLDEYVRSVQDHWACADWQMIENPKSFPPSSNTSTRETTTHTCCTTSVATLGSSKTRRTP